MYVIEELLNFKERKISSFYVEKQSLNTGIKIGINTWVKRLMMNAGCSIGLP
jgi:hypothetical protein